MVVVALLITTTTAALDQEDAHAHARLACGTCHTGGTLVGGVDVDRHCLACHAGKLEFSRTRTTFHDQGDRHCGTCHVFHRPERLHVGDREFSYSFGDATVQDQCRSCHASGSFRDVDAAHREAADVVYHTDRFDLGAMSPSQACLICHGRDGEGLLDGLTSRPPRFDTHATHPFEVGVQPGSGRGAARIRDRIDPRLPRPGGRIACQTCHDLTAGRVDLLVPFDDPYALCLGCHRLRPDEPNAGRLVLTDNR